MITTLRDVNLETDEGKLFMAALAMITTSTRRDKTPDEVIDECNKLLIEKMHLYEPIQKHN